MNAIVLSAGQGWHNAELQRAFGERGHTCALLPIARTRVMVVDGRVRVVLLSQ